MWGLGLGGEHVLLGAHRIGLSWGPHLLLKQPLLESLLQTGSCLCTHRLGELAYLSHVSLLHLLHVVLHSLLLLLLLLLLGVPDALGLLELVVVGHPRPQRGSRSLLLLLALLLDHLVPPHQEVAELGSHPRVIHVHLLRLRIHPGHGLLRLLLRLLLRHAGPLHARLHGVHVLHGRVGVHPRLLPLHGLLRLEPRLPLGHPGLPRHPLGVLRARVLGGPLLDESGQQLRVGVKDVKHLLLLHG